MTGTTFKTAPPGTVCCYLCHRYLAAGRLDDSSRCRDRLKCGRAAARMLGLPPRLSKKTRQRLGMA